MADETDMGNASRLSAQVSGVSAGLAGLAAALWCERDAIEDLLYRITLERLVLQDSPRFLPRAEDDLRAAMARLRDVSAERADIVAALADELDLPRHCGLGALVSTADEPWPTVLTGHRRALRLLVRDVARAESARKRQLRIATRSVGESLAEVRDARRCTADSVVTALDPFRSVERELIVTAAESTHRIAQQAIDLDVLDALVAFVR